jgi:hypothetical protein
MEKVYYRIMTKKIKKTSRKAVKRLTKRVRPHVKIAARKKKIVERPRKKVKILRFNKRIKKTVRKIRNKKIFKKVKPRKVVKIKAKRTAKKRPVKKIKRIKKVAKKVKRSTKRRKSRKVKSIKPRVYIGKGILEQLFESQPKLKLLKFFFRNSKDVFQQKDIFKRLRSNISILRQELNKLENIGIIKQKKAWLSLERKRGGIKKEKRIVYYLNPGFDFVNELRNLILKSTISSKDDLINTVRRLGNIKLLVLSGVFTADDASRVDLLIVGDKINQRKFNNFLKDLEAEVGKELNCAVMTSKEFNYRYDMYDRFVRDLLTGKNEVLINRVNLW